jgi:hypothetical protein
MQWIHMVVAVIRRTLRQLHTKKERTILRNKNSKENSPKLEQ